MKHYLNKLLLGVLALVVLAGCNKDENQVVFEQGTAPALTASRTGTIPLTFATANDEAIKLMWTNPNYRFNTGSSSQNVNYQIEIDTVGANFTNPKKKTISVSSDLSHSITVANLNDYLLNQLELTAGMPHQVQFRVKSFIGTNAVPLYSTPLTFTITPYAIPPKVQPYSNEVYVVGSATAGGWNNPVPVPGQKMTQLTPLTYEITLPLIGGQSYLLLPVNGSWSQKYGFDGANNSNDPMGGDFKREGGDILAPALSGNYKIELNFQTGKFKLTKL